MRLSNSSDRQIKHKGTVCMFQEHFTLLLLGPWHTASHRRPLEASTNELKSISKTRQSHLSTGSTTAADQGKDNLTKYRNNKCRWFTHLWNVGHWEKPQWLWSGNPECPSHPRRNVSSCKPLQMQQPCHNWSLTALHPNSPAKTRVLSTFAYHQSVLHPQNLQDISSDEHPNNLEKAWLMQKMSSCV